MIDTIKDIHNICYVHRDLKPLNICLKNNIPFLIDFGLSKKIVHNNKHNIEKNINSNVLTLGVGATIERAISLTLSLGYRRLIILGVDLKDTKYFWTDKDIDFKEISTDQKNVGYHRTAIRVLGSLPVQETIVILDKIAREFYDSRILISTNKSMLSSDLEKYNWKNN